jgi:hypothetical protein
MDMVGFSQLWQFLIVIELVCAHNDDSAVRRDILCGTIYDHFRNILCTYGFLKDSTIHGQLMTVPNWFNPTCAETLDGEYSELTISYIFANPDQIPADVRHLWYRALQDKLERLHCVLERTNPRGIQIEALPLCYRICNISATTVRMLPAFLLLFLPFLKRCVQFNAYDQALVQKMCELRMVGGVAHAHAYAPSERVGDTWSVDGNASSRRRTGQHEPTLKRKRTQL